MTEWTWKRRLDSASRIGLLAMFFTILFWGTWSFFAPVPVVDEVILIHNWTIDTPEISRWWDAPSAGVFVALNILIFTYKRLVAEEDTLNLIRMLYILALSFGLTLGLIYTLILLLICGLFLGLIFGLSTRLFSGLIFELIHGLNIGPAFGLAVGSVFGLTFGLTNGLTHGLIIGLIYGSAIALAFGLTFALTLFTRTIWKIYFGKIRDWLLAHPLD